MSDDDVKLVEALKAAQQIVDALAAIKGKKLAIAFRDEATAQHVGMIIENATKVSRALLNHPNSHATGTGASMTYKHGDVVQVSPSYKGGWGGCFVLVTDPKSWGVQGFVQIPCGGQAYIRLPNEVIHLIGRAEWAPAADATPEDAFDIQPDRK